MRGRDPVPTPPPRSPKDVGDDGRTVPIPGFFPGVPTQLYQTMDAERRLGVVGEPGHDGAVPPLSLPLDPCPARGVPCPRRGGLRPSCGVSSLRWGISCPCRGVPRPSWRVSCPSWGLLCLHWGVSCPSWGVSCLSQEVPCPSWGVPGPSRGVPAPSRGVSRPSREVPRSPGPSRRLHLRHRLGPHPV